MKQNIVLMFTLIALLAGCSSMPLSKQQVNKVQSIAIINNFPQYPSYSSIGTTVFQNSYDKIINKNYQEELSSIFAKYLGQKGYKNARSRIAFIDFFIFCLILLSISFF
jgi:PBP1b-binding outer membrane lipoprotein LpoB